jgi:hypothetical protein
MNKNPPITKLLIANRNNEIVSAHGGASKCSHILNVRFPLYVYESN